MSFSSEKRNSSNGGGDSLACLVKMMSCFCLPSDDGASPGEFVHHFQLYTKDFTTTEVPLTMCNEYKELPVFVREMQQKTAK